METAEVTLDYPATDWFDAVWRDMEELLILGNQFCQKTKVLEFRRCLYQKSLEGFTAEEGLQACDPLFQAVPKNDAGGSVTLSGQTYFGDADPNVVQLTYPSSGGNVQGTVNFQRYDDVFGCTYTVKAQLDGSYDPSTCELNGTASIKAEYAGDVCVSVCGSAPSSPASCPVMFDLSCGWEASHEDGQIWGTIVNCDRGYFQFRVPFQ
jgi:hypothetical protein